MNRLCKAGDGIAGGHNAKPLPHRYFGAKRPRMVRTAGEIDKVNQRPAAVLAPFRLQRSWQPQALRRQARLCRLSPLEQSRP